MVRRRTSPIISSGVSFMDFWSLPSSALSLTTVSGVINCNNVVVAGIPTGATILRVVTLLKVDFIRDTSGADNSVTSATMVVEVSSHSDHSLGSAGITIPTSSFAVVTANSEDLAGTVIVGNVDVSSVITGNATYYIRFNNAQVTGNNLDLHGIMVGVRVYFTV